MPAAESVAEHSFRASIIAAVIAVAEDADPQRAAFLALWHDTQETRTTDLHHLTKRYVTTAANKTVTGDQVRTLTARRLDVAHRHRQIPRGHLPVE